MLSNFSHGYSLEVQSLTLFTSISQNWQTVGALSSHTNDTAENVSPTSPPIWDAIIIAHTLAILLPLCSPALGLQRSATVVVMWVLGI